jgi:type IX secretion system PorP/SprF family membrane protein
MKFKLLLFTLLLTLTIKVNAQDAVFTQYFLVPETINPAFTGTLAASYAGLIHRSQWPDGFGRIDNEFGFVNAPIDVDGKMGLGLTILNNREEFTNYNYLQFNGTYSYRIDMSDYWKLRLGIEAGYGHKNYNYSNTLLEDQIDSGSGVIIGPSVDPGFLNYSDSISFFDLSSGFLIYNDEAWFGLAIKHLNRPNIAVIEYNDVALNMFFSFHGGYAFTTDNLLSGLADESKFLLTGNYMRQGEYNRLDLGGAFELHKFTLGATITTNPENKSKDSRTLTSINLLTAIKLDRFVLGYSYDINTTGAGNAQNIHEFSLTFQLGRICKNCYSDFVKQPWGRNYIESN